MEMGLLGLAQYLFRYNLCQPFHIKRWKLASPCVLSWYGRGLLSLQLLSQDCIFCSHQKDYKCLEICHSGLY